MLDLIIALATFAFALIVAFARFDLQPTYYIFGAIYALCVGALLGSQPAARIKGYRLHLWIAGICACFLLMWYAAGSNWFSGFDVENATPAKIAGTFTTRVLLLYVGIYLASRASDALRNLASKIPLQIGNWVDVFVKTPAEVFTDANRKMRAIVSAVLLVAGAWAVITGDLPAATAILKDIAGMFGSGD